jgi:hypothetical protein
LLIVVVDCLLLLLIACWCTSYVSPPVLHSLAMNMMRYQLKVWATAHSLNHTHIAIRHPTTATYSEHIASLGYGLHWAMDWVGLWIALHWTY